MLAILVTEAGVQAEWAADRLNLARLEFSGNECCHPDPGWAGAWQVARSRWGGSFVLVQRCLGRPGTALTGLGAGGPVAGVHAALCPAGHQGSVPVMVLDLSRAGGPVPRPGFVAPGCCPACPGEQLSPAGHAAAGACGSAAWCRCCLAAWWPGTGWWACPDTGRLISVAGPVSQQARIGCGLAPGRVWAARALAGFLVSGPGPAARAVADGPFCVCLYELAGRRYAVVIGGSAQIKAVFKITRGGAFRPLDWLRASTGPAALGLLGMPAHLR